MCNKFVFLFVVLALSPLTFAQHNQRPSAAGVAQLASETCAFTFKSGAGHGGTQYCVTANGNIAQFSAVGGNGLPLEMLNGFAPATEGYGLCDLNSLTPYWDYAQTASSNWNTATAVLNNANTVTITRTTADGVWKLVQTITQMKGSKTSYGAAKISMALTNLSATDRLIFFNRHANIDADGSFFNDFDTTQTTAFGLAEGGNSGLSSTASFVTTAFDFSLAFVMTVPGGPTPCTPFDNQGAQLAFFQGDGAVEQIFNLDILPGKTKTVTVTYKPI